ncbi:MAG: hypothetical protein M1540_02125 [Candidatus Bathyarchaeota archaeon]|nr:hypothetical protein [Candidatus Bathyarchaeota archaeon]
MSLYVGVGVYGTPQDRNWRRLHFGAATFLCVCYGVAYAISTTRSTYFYVETVRMWM